MKAIKLLKITIILYVIATVIISLMSFSEMPSLNVFNEDKPIHFVIYFGLSFLLSISYNIKSFEWNKALMILIITFGFGLIMEICQEFFTTYRRFEWKDILANTFGAITGMVFAYFLKNYLKMFFF